jgi:hypothetical protein
MKRLPPLVALLVVALCVVASGAAKERPKSKAQLAREAKAAEKAIKNLKVPEGWLVPSEDMKVGAKGWMMDWEVETVEIIDGANAIGLVKSFNLPGPDDRKNNPPTSVYRLPKPIKVWFVDGGALGSSSVFRRNDGNIRLQFYFQTSKDLFTFSVVTPKKAKTESGEEEELLCILLTQARQPKPPQKDFSGPNNATAAK